jgi:hypothetical protein
VYVFHRVYYWWCLSFSALKITLFVYFKINININYFYHLIKLNYTIIFPNKYIIFIDIVTNTNLNSKPLCYSNNIHSRTPTNNINKIYKDKDKIQFIIYFIILFL